MKTSPIDCPCEWCTTQVEGATYVAAFAVENRSIILKWCKSPEDTDFETHLYDVAEVHKVMPASYKGRKHHYIYAQPEDMASLDPLSGYIMTRYTQWHLRYNFEGEMIVRRIKFHMNLLSQS